MADESQEHRHTQLLNFEDRLRDLPVVPGTVACVWLGQAGYWLKSPGGVSLLIDPYLTESAEPVWGVKRVVPPAIDHTRSQPDLFLSTHWHEDHLDPPVVRHYAEQAGIVFVGSPSSAIRAGIWGWPTDRIVSLSRGETHRHADVAITATFALHDEAVAPTPDAIGFLLDLGGTRLWHVGDSVYTWQLRAMRREHLDVMFVPINGGGGNCDAEEAALLAWKVRPKVAVPNHYDMWAPEDFGPGATLDPTVFVETLAKLGGGVVARELTVGEVVIFGADA
jgi:L-ascorbate 6-phosphate lactonase